MMKYLSCLLVVKDAQKSKYFYQELLQCTVVLDLGVHVAFSDGFALQEENSWLELINKEKNV